MELRDASLSISRQARVPLGGGERGYGGIIDPARGRPVESSTTVVVRAASATEADALSTTLVLLSIDEGKRLLEGFPRASALWISVDGKVAARYRDVGAARVNW
jgi:thiamine biosynthesis lipoprotein ApbE